jgi:hypothetical protein
MGEKGGGNSDRQNGIRASAKRAQRIIRAKGKYKLKVM